MTTFDYSALRGKIKEKCNTQMIFAQKMGLSSVSVSEKLNGRSWWSQLEICRALEILEISPISIAHYFFKQKLNKCNYIIRKQTPA